ncbi:MAG: DUF2513 domain-containing protein [Lachnospiraceae bacterium]|nr:DUF2513 domain-containing protein [Lachnospiraceae bacterium]
MKLNPYCIKDILIVLEAIVTDAGVTYFFDSWEDLQKQGNLQKYPINELAYHCQQIYLSGYLYQGKLYPHGGMSFIDLTPDAHSFLSGLRTPVVFETVKKFINITGSASISQMASVVTTASAEFLRNFIASQLR